MTHAILLTELRNKINTAYNLEELQLLCADFGLDHQKWGWPIAKETLIQNLLDELQRVGRLRALLTYLRQQRPEHTWPTLDESSDGEPNDPLAAYRRNCIRRWSGLPAQLDQHFVRLSLLRQDDQRGFVPAADAREYHDLRHLLDDPAVTDRAVVLLGAPGSGKSTLLRRLQLDVERDALNAAPNPTSQVTSPITFFAALNRYPAEATDPRRWLAGQWRAENSHPDLPDFDALLDEGRLLLLLDALNEMRLSGVSQYADKVEQWREFGQVLAQRGNRAVFTCRSLDYSSALSSEAWPVGQVTVKPMNADLVEKFLNAYLPDLPELAARTLAQLRADARLLDFYSTPYFLNLLVQRVRADGNVPRGRADLFTGYVRDALHREVSTRKTPLLLNRDLLHERDQTLINSRAWRGYALPELGLLLPKLTALAFDMQQRGQEVSLPLGEAHALLSHAHADEVVKAGEALNVLDEDLNTAEVRFFHQLLQEYFAARQLSRAPLAQVSDLVQQAWRADEVQPSLAETLADLPDREPLPRLPSTGWEETARIAAALSSALTPTLSRQSGEGVADGFVRAVMEANLPLAGLCAAAPDVRVSQPLKSELQWALVQRSQDLDADLRARIAAGEALGQLGDPRLERRTGPHGDYLLPPLVKIAGGRYVIGDDDSGYESERPAHAVEVAPFEMGVFAVTNAEFRCFVEVKGYEDERWWDTDAAKRWLAGETSEGPKKTWRDNRKTLQGVSEETIQSLVSQNRITSKQAEDWITIRNWSDQEFEDWLKESFPSGKQYRQPKYWDDPTFNNPAQPVVGVCWHEARAYCNWLSAQTGQTIRLPSEAEWEAAARGLPSPASGRGAGGEGGRTYAYGDDFDPQRGNTFESHIRKTTPVGIYPNGATPEGIYDLTGNTWDWTSSAYLPYEYAITPEREDANVDAEYRVVRGGAWYGNQNFARTAFRDWLTPDYRYYNLGFRVVGVLPPPGSER